MVLEFPRCGPSICQEHYSACQGYNAAISRSDEPNHRIGGFAILMESRWTRLRCFHPLLLPLGGILFRGPPKMVSVYFLVSLCNQPKQGYQLQKKTSTYFGFLAAKPTHLPCFSGALLFGLGVQSRQSWKTGKAQSGIRIDQILFR